MLKWAYPPLMNKLDEAEMTLMYPIGNRIVLEVCCYNGEEHVTSSTFILF